MVERVLIVHGQTGPRTAKRAKYQVTYYTYLASSRQLSYTPSIVRVAGWTIREMQPISSANFHHFPIMSSHMRKRYLALPAFPYCKRQKAGWNLGTRLSYVYTACAERATNFLVLVVNSNWFWVIRSYSRRWFLVWAWFLPRDSGNVCSVMLCTIKFTSNEGLLTQ